MQMADEIKEQLYNLRTLHDFQAVDEKGVDRGVSIREKSKKLVEWVTNTSILVEERKKSESIRSKFVGIGSDGSGGQTYKSQTSPTQPYTSSSHTTSSSTQQARRSISPDSDHARGSTPPAHDVDDMAADPEVVRQQKELLAQFEKDKDPNKALRSLTPPTELAAPPAASPAKEEDLFDPFGDMAPAKPVAPKPANNDIGDFFAPAPASAPQAAAPKAAEPDLFANATEDMFAAPAAHSSFNAPSNAFSQPADDDLFASPAPASRAQPVEEDLFASPAPAFAPAPTQSHDDDLFGPSGGDPFASHQSPQPAKSAPAPAHQEAHSMFDDPTFALCSGIDSLGKKAKPAAQASPSHAAPTKSLKAMKQAQQGSPNQMFSSPPPQQQQFQSSGNDFNPFA
eukprot:NODE_2038_length_1531_cov_79.656250_g1940_i0.p1 GENE.NODE_2038_length_1531_cov_79.656250_g1940_i0~~NODE_2038_length_1531_cov_79.656250_g1940_i0.p1  ORF type:complete len:415 (-),score=93.74 NODE_2038_length_1531_cov_79.656250_g1940_i0:286-1476(-)